MQGVQPLFHLPSLQSSFGCQMGLEKIRGSWAPFAKLAVVVHAFDFSNLPGQLLDFFSQLYLLCFTLS